MKKCYFDTAQILLPKKDFEKWAVIACDQFTSEQNYWDKARDIVGDSNSALNIILPEIYLENDNSKRIEKINENMKKYLDSEVFDTFEHSMIYVERESNGTVRQGIVGLIDLEDYDYRKGAHSLIRATEQTVLERIPPRVAIRRDALLELPHVMLLVDDPNFTVIAPLAEKKNDLKSAYDFELMLSGGHINGYFLDKTCIEQVQGALESLVENSDDQLLFAVGDGNHSLATAKECYLQSKSEKARYALVEIVNIHDSSIEFEPIYRVLFNVDEKAFLDEFVAFVGLSDKDNAQSFTCVSKHKESILSVNPTSKLPVGTLQSFIDGYLSKHTEVTIDYIHGEDVVRELCKKDNTLGFIFNGMQKNELFDAVRADGSLPRKTFSMGHASDKRYYIEARKIRE